jgi:hypothetical protein
MKPALFVTATLLMVGCAPTRSDADAPGMPPSGEAVVVTYYYLNF